MENRSHEQRTLAALTLRCKDCGQRVTKAIFPLAKIDLSSAADGESVVPAGRIVFSDDVLTDEPFYQLSRAEVMVHFDDLIDVRTGGIRNGCCGPDGLDGINLFCANGHPIGTEVADCWTPHFVHIPLERVAIEREKAEIATDEHG